MPVRTWLLVIALGLAASTSSAQEQSTAEDEPRQEESTSNGEDRAATDQEPSLNTLPALQGIEAAIRNLVTEADHGEEDRAY